MSEETMHQNKTTDFSVLLLHPGPVSAALLIFWNSFYLRRHHPGFWSGKLSDVGICFLLPVLLAATGILFYKIFSFFNPKQKAIRSEIVALLSCLLAAGYFSALNLVPAFAYFHETWMGFLLGTTVWTTMDMTDLICLTFTILAYFFIRKRLFSL